MRRWRVLSDYSDYSGLLRINLSACALPACVGAAEAEAVRHNSGQFAIGVSVTMFRPAACSSSSSMLMLGR